MNKLIIFSFLFIAVIISCVDKEKTQEYNSSTKYLKNGHGRKIKDGDFVILNLKYFDYDGNLMFNGPVVQRRDSLWENIPFLKVISKLNEGDSVFFQISVDDFFGHIPNAPAYPDSIRNELFSFYCGVNNIMIMEEFETFQREQAIKQQIEMEMNQKQQLSIDSELIDNYLKDNDIDAVKTASGLRYVITNEGTGENASPGDRVTVHYTGMLLDGTTFDSSVERADPFSFDLGQGNVIKGWDEGITYFNKGSIGTIYIPSSLGYGPSGAGGVIPPNAVLIFDIELLDY